MASDPDLSEFEALAHRGPVVCKVGRYLKQLNEKDRRNAQAALAAEHIATGTIAKWFQGRGLYVSDKSVKPHREGSCCCER